MKLPIFTILLTLPLSFCATMNRDVSKNVSEIDPYASYTDSANGDQTVSVGGRVLFRDPELRK